MKVVVTGASGFVGNHLIGRLVADGHDVVGLVRSLVSAERRVSGSVRYAVGVDVTDPSTLNSEEFAGADAVVHLVGIIAERPPLETFARIHIQGTRNVVEAARAAAVGKLIYISAIGAAADASAEYSRTKFAAEEIVRASGVDFTVLRPSIILGKYGEFVAQMRDLVRFGGLPIKIPAPIVPIPGSGHNLFQPIDVHDLATCVLQSVAGRTANKATIEIAGATQVSFNDLIQAFAAAERVNKPLLHVPIPLLALVAPIVEKLPNPPFTADQLKNLQIDNVADLGAMKATFGFTPIGFDQIMRKLAG